MWKFFLLATGEAQVVSSFVLLNIYYILWKKAKRGVSLFLNDSDCIVCSLYVEFRLLWVHCRKGSIHPRWGTVCHHFRSDALIFILSVSKLWHSKTVSKPANKILVTEIFIALVLNSFKKEINSFVILSDFYLEVFNFVFLCRLKNRVSVQFP